jgi:endonuclease/exonuclease/phosphatase family metal-dependent hydrolase
LFNGAPANSDACQKRQSARQHSSVHQEPQETLDAPHVGDRCAAEGTLIASYNVHKCVGNDRRFDPERTSRVIHEIDADVIALQEADTRFGERTGILDMARLERETGLVPVPVSGMAKAHGWHGNVVLFKKGLVRDVHQIKLPGLEPRGALVAELELERGGGLRIIAAHFGLLRHSRAQQARVLVELMADTSRYADDPARRSQRVAAG